MQATQQQDAPLQMAVSVEGLLYVIIVVAAVMLRLVALGAVPLSAAEVPHAVAAWAAIEPSVDAATGPTSALLHNLSALFMLLGGLDEAAVRLPAALGGIALTLTPLLFREQLGRVATLVAVLLLAILPAAVIPARAAGGAALAMLFIMLALAAVNRYTAQPDERWLWAASASMALALLADYGTLVVFVGLLMAALLTFATDDEGALAGVRLLALPWRNMVLVFAGVAVLVGAGLFLLPGGLSGLAEGLQLFVVGLTRRVAGVTPLPVLLALYEPGVLILGVVGAALAFRSPAPRVRFLAGWGIAMLFLSLVYQGGQPGHMLWVTVPFALLAAYTTQDMLDTPHDGPEWGVWLSALAVVTLFTLLLFSLTMHLRRPDLVPVGGIQISLQVALAVMWVVLLLAIWMSAAAVYGPEMGTIGAWCGFLGMIMVVAFGHSVDISFTRQSNPYELAIPAQAQPSLIQMLATMEQTSELSAGGPFLASVTVQGAQESVVGWAVRDFEDVQFVSTLNAGITSDMVITPLAGSEQPTLGSEYVGQSYVITRQWSAPGSSPSVILRWLLYHRVDQPTAEEAVILWVRDDLYRIGGDAP